MPLRSRSAAARIAVIRPPKSLLAALLLAACVTDGSGLSRGEHLVQNLPATGPGWTAFSKTEGNRRHFMWKDSDGTVVMLVTVLPVKQDDMEVLYQADVDAQSVMCTEQTIERIDDRPKYDYAMLLWYSTCALKDGGSRFILSKAFGGRDSFYFIQRIWNAPPDGADLARWKTLLAEAFICDTRRSDAPCPTDLGVKKPGLDF